MLKPALEVVQSDGRLSFLVRAFGEEAFRAPYHFHPEYELTLITAGEGNRYVGTRMSAFAPGDLVLLGSGLPHCWKRDAGEKAEGAAAAIVIQFNADFLGAGFFSRPELTHISKLLERSAEGIQFTGRTRDACEGLISSLAGERNNFEKMIRLLELLEGLALSRDYRLLVPGQSIQGPEAADRQRISAVVAYVVENFRQQVSLREASRAAGMTPNAFCRYFRRITRKTFMETVIAYRIHYAARQLVQTDQTVSAICYDSGFGDVSHFNKTFKGAMKMSPLHYRKKFHETAGGAEGDD
jgi:AraC-like DNA-binding protein